MIISVFSHLNGIYNSGFINPTKDEEANEPIQAADQSTTIPDFSVIESRKF
jgi:hypothetical protein